MAIEVAVATVTTAQTPTAIIFEWEEEIAIFAV